MIYDISQYAKEKIFYTLYKFYKYTDTNKILNNYFLILTSTNRNNGAARPTGKKERRRTFFQDGAYTSRPIIVR